MEIVLSLIAIALMAILTLLIFLIRRPANADYSNILNEIVQTQERMERSSREESVRAEKTLRDEFTSQRKEITDNLLSIRLEIGTMLKNSSDSLSTSVETFRTGNLNSHESIRKTLDEKLSSFESRFTENIALLNSDSSKSAKDLKEEISKSLKSFNESTLNAQREIANVQKNQFDSFSLIIHELTTTNESRFASLRQTVEAKLQELQLANDSKLEEMRKTVDEKLQGTLERRLGESFKLVSDRLEQVQKGLGEMQTLAIGVGDLKKVLTNVKSRGTWGEIQLEALLEDMLSPEQFVRNSPIRPRSNERVEFAIRLPGKDDSDSEVLLPIDSKFPREDYERLIQAQEKGDPNATTVAGQQLEVQIKKCARDIKEKYIHPPYSTDFGILFLPVESLFAEVLRRPGLFDSLQQEYRVTVAGPTTLCALLNSLQMGFRTLAVQKRSSEVWKVLGAVKTEFGKFGAILEKVGNQLQTAQNTIQTASSKSRRIHSKLKGVEELAPADTKILLGDDVDILEVAEPVDLISLSATPQGGLYE